MLRILVSAHHYQAATIPESAITGPRKPQDRREGIRPRLESVHWFEARQRSRRRSSIRFRFWEILTGRAPGHSCLSHCPAGADLQADAFPALKTGNDSKQVSGGWISFWA